MVVYASKEDVTMTFWLSAEFFQGGMPENHPNRQGV
jgi:hypothetical protein